MDTVMHTVNLDQPVYRLVLGYVDKCLGERISLISLQERFIISLARANRLVGESVVCR